MSKRAIDDDSSSSEDIAHHDVKSHRQEQVQDSEKLITCSLPPHCNLRPKAYTLTEYEAHYQRQHVNVCYECDAELPTSLFLDLHLEEQHSPIFQAQIDRGESAFRCFVESCKSKFKSQTARRRHLETDHDYPASYRFNLVQKGLDRRVQSLLFPVKSNQPSRSYKKVESNVPAKVGVMTRAQRRAAEREAAGADQVMEIDKEEAKPDVKMKLETKSKQVDAKAEHAKAVAALFESLQIDSDASPVPDTIKFGHKR